MKIYKPSLLRLSKALLTFLVIATVGFIPQNSYSTDVPATGGTAGNYTLNSSVVVTSGTVTNTAGNTQSTVVLSSASNGNTLTINPAATITETNGHYAITASGDTTANITVAGGKITAAANDNVIYNNGYNLGTITVNTGSIAATGTGNAITLSGGTITGIVNSKTISAASGSAIDITGATTITNNINNLASITASDGNVISINGALTGAINNGSSVNNTAIISNANAGYALSLNSDVTGGVNNYGVISGHTNSAIYISADQTSQLHNFVGGTISSAINKFGIAPAAVVIDANLAGGLLNEGTITNTSTGGAVLVKSAMTGSITNGSTTNSTATLSHSSTTTPTLALSADVGGGVANYGTISGTGSTAIAVNAAQTSQIRNYATGVITSAVSNVTPSGAIAIGADIAGDLLNEGIIQETSSGAGILVTSDMATGAIINGSNSNSTATIQNTSSGYGMYLGGNVGGGVDNYGVISGNTGFAVYVNAAQTSSDFINESTGVITSGSGNTFNIAAAISKSILNYGTIQNTSNGNAIKLTSDVVGGITNSGLITAGGGSAVFVVAPNTASITNLGTMRSTGGITERIGIVGAMTGSVVNGSATNSTATIEDTSSGTALFLASDITGGVQNYGKIASATGLAVSIRGPLTSAAFTNESTGLITSGTTASTFNISYDISKNLINYGTIQNTSTGNVISVNGAMTSGGIVNEVGGVIQNTSAGVANYATSIANAIYVSADIVGGITNSGLISVGSGSDIYFSGPHTASITNLGTMQSTDGLAIRILNAGAMDGSITNGSATNSTATIEDTGSGQAIYMASNVTGGVDNYGVISSGTGLAVNVNAAQTASIINESTGLITSGSVTRSTVNINYDISNDLINYGTIENTSAGSAIFVHGAMTTGGINNEVGGVIRNTSTGTALNILADVGGGVNNSGLISVESGNGIYINVAATGDINNLGTVQSTAGTAINVNAPLTGTITNGSAGNSTATIQDTASGTGLSLASDVTGGVDNYGAISSGTGRAVNINSAQTSAFTNESSGLITSGSAASTFNINADISNNLINYGTIQNTSTGSAVFVASEMTNGAIINQAGGAITSNSTGAGLYLNANVGGGVQNYGTITNTANTGNAILVNSAQTSAIVNESNGFITSASTNGPEGSVKINADLAGGLFNYGTIENTSTVGMAVGVTSAMTGGINNEVGGVIQNTAGGVAGIFIAADIGGGVTNLGSIIGTTFSGIRLYSPATITGGITNNGLISVTSGNGIYTNAAVNSGITNLGTVQSTGGKGIFVNIATLTGAIVNGSASNSTATIKDTTTGTGLNLGADVTGGVDNYGVISSGTGTAVNVFAAQSGAFINESTGVITTAGTGGAIVIADVATNGITNDGTISSTNGAPIAIDASAQTTGSNAFTITNNGTIAGEVKLGAGDTFTQNSGSTSNGSNVAILGLDGSETVNLNGGTIAGDIGASGKSIGTLNISSAQTLHNIYSTAMNFTNDSTLNIASGSSFNSDNFATAAITTATDNTGTINFNGSTNINNIIGTSANRLKAVNFDSGTANVNQAVNSYNMNIASGVLANLFTNSNHNISSLTNNGTMVVGSNNAVSGLGDLVIGSGGILTIGVESPTAYSRLSGTSLTNNGVITIDASNITTALPNNTLLTGVFTGTSAPSIVNNLQLSSNNSAYRFFEKINGNNMDILVQNATPSSNVSLLDVIQHASMSSIEGRISALTSDAAALQHITPGAGGDEEPMAMHYKNIWVDVFGSDIKQNQHANVSGYNASMSGIIVGADVYLDKNETATAGAAFAYSGTNSEGVGAESDTGSYQGSLYYTYKPLDSKLYYDGIASFAYNRYDNDRVLPDATVANSKFSGVQYSIKNKINYDIDMASNIKLTPMASIQYSFLSQNPYTETGSSANLHIDTKDINVLKSGLGTKISRVFNYDDIIYTPNVSLEWLHDFIGDATQTTANFDGTSTYVTARGASVLKDSARIGAGVNMVMNSHFNLSLDYGLEKMPNYTVNSLSFKSSYEF